MADLIFFLLTVRSLLVTVQQSHKGTAQKQAKQRLKLCFKVGLHYFLIIVKKVYIYIYIWFVSVCVLIHPCTSFSICMSVNVQQSGFEKISSNIFLFQLFLVMGISWFAEIIAYQFGPSSFGYISNIFNCSQVCVNTR